MSIEDFHVGVKAVIERDDKVLLLHKASKDIWEGAGGRIDGDETIGETLLRELNEELPGIENIAVGELLHADRLPGRVLGERALLLVWYRVTADFPAGISISDEHDDFGWFSIAEVKDKASDGIREAVDKL